jgi:hypothetical protein
MMKATFNVNEIFPNSIQLVMLKDNNEAIVLNFCGSDDRSSTVTGSPVTVHVGKLLEKNTVYNCDTVDGLIKVLKQFA